MANQLAVGIRAVFDVVGHGNRAMWAGDCRAAGCARDKAVVAAAVEKKYGLFSNNVICLFTHSIVSPIDQPIEVRSFNDIKGHKVIVSENSFSYQEMIAAGIEEYAIPQTDMNEIPYIDKVVHTCMYGGLCLVIWFEYLRQHKSISFKRRIRYHN